MGGEEAIPVAIHTVVENIDKMDFTSRIRCSHVLRQWSIYSVNTTRAVPKVKEDKFISETTWGKKLHSVPVLLTAAFLRPVSVCLVCHNQRSRNKARCFHYVSGQCQPRTRNACLLFRLQKKRLKSRQRAACERLFKVVQIWRRVLLYKKILQCVHKLIQCVSEA